VSTRPSEARPPAPDLSERQASVLRAVVTGFVGGGEPIGSRTLSHLLPLAISSASIRNVLAELTELGLVEKPHASAGRVPTERGLRLFVDELLAPVDLAASERRDIAYRVEEAEGEGVVHLASELLSRHTRQLGFVVAPRLDRVVLRYLSLVRLSSERLLVVLISRTGTAFRRVVEDGRGLGQADLDRIAALLNERVAGRTLRQVRDRLAREASTLRRQANVLLLRALELGMRAVAAPEGPIGDLVIETRLALLDQPEFSEIGDLVIETRLALLDQPEFSDPRRLRDLFAAIETKERLIEVIEEMLAPQGVSVAFGEEIEEPALRRCALVAAPYGGRAGDAPLGVLGVIGPSRMDYSRVISLVDYLSHLITGKLDA
jgi:heat-inducible transcriptional repressor